MIGKIVEGTQLTRKTVVRILQGIREDVFGQFKINPEDFIIKVSNLINDEKATVIIEHIQYNKLEQSYDTVFYATDKETGEYVNLQTIKTGGTQRIPVSRSPAARPYADEDADG